MFFNDDNRFTKFGYFTIDGIKTFSKYEAWKISKERNLSADSIEFNFNDEFMSTLDWSVEPETSIGELYRQRAVQLREKYDYLVLLYSGGIDSQVMLNTFLKHGIRVDEIVTIGNTKFQDKSAKLNQEVFKKAIPYLETVDLSKIGAKFTYIDIGQLIADQFIDKHHFDNFLYLSNGPLSPWVAAFRSAQFKLNNTSHVTISNSGRKICYMWGYDKPSLDVNDGNWCFKFTDSVADFSIKPYNNQVILGGPLVNFYDEPFFVTPDLPEMTIKQCHMAVNMLKTIKFVNDTRLSDVEYIPNTGPFIEHPVGNTTTHGKWLKKKELERIIYPDENPDHFGDDKVRGSVMFTTRDKWFFHSNTESRNKLVRMYKQLFRTEHDYFRYNIDDVAINSISFSSKHYIIDTL